MKAKPIPRIDIHDRMELKEVLPLRTPYVIHIDPCDTCNFHCKFCPSGNLEMIIRCDILHFVTGCSSAAIRCFVPINNFIRKGGFTMQNQKTLSFWDANGEIHFNMTNNYMFRYILQTHEKVLKGLVCALLHLKPEQVHSVMIKNPINLAGDVEGKEFILDINVMMNNEKLLNLEMQNLNEHNWPERSLSYLCRSYDQLYRGQKYEEVLPVIHIGFLDFTLHPDVPEFYATYQLLNIENHRLYSDKFTLSVVNLSCIELATEEDRAYEIDYWAAMFKAKTWEEVKKLAKENEYLQEAAKQLYIANADEIVRQQCIAREDAERRERTLERDIRLLKSEKEAQAKVLAEKESEIERLKALLEENGVFAGKILEKM